MTLRKLLALLVVSTLAACSEPTVSSTEQQIIDDATAAIGGISAIQSATTLSIEGEGIMGNHGQDMTPESATFFFAISGYEQVSDLSSNHMRIELTRTPNFNYFRGPGPISQQFGIDNGTAYNISSDGTISRGSTAQAAERQFLYYHHPLRLLHAATNSSVTLANGRTEDDESLVDVTTAEGFTLTLAIDATTKLPTYIMSTENHPNLRDVSMRTRFSDYQEVSGLSLPTKLVQYIDDYELLSLNLSAQSVNGTVDLDALNVPAAAATTSAPAAVAVEKIAEGIWLLPGGYNSMVVEFSDHLVLFEAPTEARTVAVIAKARELVPGKPLTHLVNTHHHFDHSGGVRAAIAEGLSVITQAANANFYRALATNPSTVNADLLGQTPRPAEIISIVDKGEHADETMKLEFYHIAGNPHADSLLMVYFPEQKFLYQADVFTPGGATQFNVGNLASNIVERGLEVENIIPVHGGITSYEDFLMVVSQAGQ